MIKTSAFILLALWLFYISWRYYRTRELVPLLLAVVAILIIGTSAIIGNITRPVPILWFLQLFCIFLAIVVTMFAIQTKRYKLLTILVLPFLPIGLFFVLEGLVGSRN